MVVGLGWLLSLALFASLSMSIGDYPRDRSPSVIATRCSRPSPARARSGNDFIVLGVRLPRVWRGCARAPPSGSPERCSRRMLRNPLASPDIIGITTGASAAAVAGDHRLHWSGRGWLAVAALSAALATARLIYGLAWRKGVTPYRLVLVGIGIGGDGRAVMSYIFTRARHRRSAGGADAG